VDSRIRSAGSVVVEELEVTSLVGLRDLFFEEFSIAT
jgi:hypothetical protein